MSTYQHATMTIGYSVYDARHFTTVLNTPAGPTFLAGKT